MQPVKLRTRAARCARNNATGLRELWRSGGNFLLLPLKLQNFWRGKDFAMAGDWRRAAAGVLKGGSCPYDSVVPAAADVVASAVAVVVVVAAVAAADSVVGAAVADASAAVVAAAAAAIAAIAADAAAVVAAAAAAAAVDINAAFFMMLLLLSLNIFRASLRRLNFIFCK